MRPARTGPRLAHQVSIDRERVTRAQSSRRDVSPFPRDPAGSRDESCRSYIAAQARGPTRPAPLMRAFNTQRTQTSGEFGGNDMKALILAVPWLALAAVPAPAASDPSFTLSAGAEDFDRYFPSYLANGYFSTMTAPRGTEGNLAYMVAFMDYAKDDMARPAAIPGWSEIDYSTGDSAAGHFWMNQVPLNAGLFRDYSQVLNMQEATLTTSYRYVDHRRSTQIKVTTFVSEAATHLAATQISLTPDFDGTVQLSFALNLWAPYQPRLPIATLTGDEMQEAVAAHNMTLVAIPPATPDRAAVWYHGDTHVLSADGDTHELTLWLAGRASKRLSNAG